MNKEIFFKDSIFALGVATVASIIGTWVVEVWGNNLNIVIVFPIIASFFVIISALVVGIKNKLAMAALLSLLYSWFMLGIVIPASKNILMIYFANRYLFGVMFAVWSLIIVCGFIYFIRFQINKKLDILHNRNFWGLTALLVATFFIGVTAFSAPIICQKPSHDFIYLYMEPQGLQQLFLYDIKKDLATPISTSEAQVLIPNFYIDYSNNELDKYGCFSTRVGLQTPGYNAFYRKYPISGFPAIRLAGWVGLK